MSYHKVITSISALGTAKFHITDNYFVQHNNTNLVKQFQNQHEVSLIACTTASQWLPTGTSRYKTNCFGDSS